MENISMTNGLLTVKENQSVQIEALRESRVFGQIMLKKGGKFSPKFNKSNFQVSESSEYYRVVPFLIKENGSIVELDSLFGSIKIQDAKVLRSDKLKMYFVEFIHPTLNLDEVVAV